MIMYYYIIITDTTYGLLPSGRVMMTSYGGFAQHIMHMYDVITLPGTTHKHQYSWGRD